MATTYLKLLNGVATGDVLSAANWNAMTGAQDRGGGLMQWALWGSGRKTGWGLTSGASTVQSGTGQVGPCWCVTAAAQAVSGLQTGATNYIHAITTAGSPASGVVKFVARATSAVVTNNDGITTGILLGKATYIATTGLKTISSAIRDNWGIDHGNLDGLSDDDHPEYMRPLSMTLLPDTAITPATSAASTSQYGSVFRTLVGKFPKKSTTKLGWNFYTPDDYSGAITVYTVWVASGLAGAVWMGYFSRNRADGEQWDVALTSGWASAKVAISGTNTYVKRFSHTWSSNKPSAGERGQFVIRRDGAHASDNMSGTARLLSARIVFATAR